MNAETWASIGVSLATAGAAVWTARSARRTPKQERRDDFTAITAQQGAAIERLERRVQQREAEAETQRERLSEQDEAMAWLLGRVRELVGYIRKGGGEPPPPRPMSQKAARVLERIDV